MNRLKRSLWLIFYFICLSNPLLGQEDLRDDRSYFEEQILQFQPWLDQSGLSDLATFGHLEVSRDKVLLVLKSNYASEDSLQSHWKSLQKQFFHQTQRLLNKALFYQFIFFLDLNLDEGEIIIKDKKSGAAKVKIYYDQYIQMEENFSRALASRTINLDLVKVRLPDTYSSLKLESEESILLHEIRKKISRFVIAYYQDTGALWYRAHIDTSSTFYNSFTYRISCLNNEIIKDGYYEFIEFRVEITKLQNNLSVLIDINGKYASGILCPQQREKFYTMIDSEYPGKMEDYVEDMEKRINELLQGRR